MEQMDIVEERRKAETLAIFQNEETLVNIFKELQEYLKLKLIIIDGEYFCFAKKPDDERGRWLKSISFCRMKGLDDITFISKLNDILQVNCEADYLNRITIEKLIEYYRYFKNKNDLRIAG